MSRKLIFASLILFFTFGFFNFVFAKTDNVEINFFYSSTCPHCAKEERFLDELKQRYPEITINSYEVVHSPDNQKILEEFYAKYNVPDQEKGYVPVTFTPTKYFIGFNDQVEKDLEGCLKECIGGGEVVSEKIIIPILGSVDVAKVSLPLLTVILGTLDGFNPCAMWVLVILVSMLLSLKSRKKIALVGGTFIFAEGLLYFLFMTAWLNAFLVIGYVSLTRTLIGIFGIIFGIWRIRDFLTWKPGVCKVVDSSSSKDRLFEKMKNVLKPTTVPATVLGVIALAFGVNLVEFFCSAGFPVMFTRILALQNVGTFQHYLYLIFYNFFYMLDDFIVFGFAFFTMNRYSFSDRYNRYSTLVAGLLIFILGILLIFKPNILIFG